jgi:hypothetical protein
MIKIPGSLTISIHLDLTYPVSKRNIVFRNKGLKSPPSCIKDKTDKPKSPKFSLKQFSLLHSFCSLQEFFQYEATWRLKILCNW